MHSNLCVEFGLQINILTLLQFVSMRMTDTFAAPVTRPVVPRYDRM